MHTRKRPNTRDSAGGKAGKGGGGGTQRAEETILSLSLSLSHILFRSSRVSQLAAVALAPLLLSLSRAYRARYTTISDTDVLSTVHKHAGTCRGRSIASKDDVRATSAS